MDTVSIALLQVESSDSSVWDPSGSVSVASADSTTYFVVCFTCHVCWCTFCTLYLKWLFWELIWDLGSSSREGFLSFCQNLRSLSPGTRPEDILDDHRVSPCPISNCSPLRSLLNAEGGHNGKKNRREGKRRKEKRQENMSLYTGWRWAWIEMKLFTLGRVLSHRPQNCLWQFYLERKFSTDIIWRAKIQGRVQGGCVACVHSKGGHEGQRKNLAFLGPFEDLDSCCVCPVDGEFLKKRKRVQILSRQTE